MNKVNRRKLLALPEHRLLSTNFKLREDVCPILLQKCVLSTQQYRGADKSLVRPTSRCILFHGENISFDASLVKDTNSTNIPQIMIINWIY